MAKRHAADYYLKEIINDASLIYFICLLIVRIPLSHMMGDGGVGYFSGPFEIFFLLALLPGTAITKTIRSQMRARINRNQFRNAHLFWVCAFRSAFVYTLLATFGLIVFSKKIAVDFLLAPGLRIAILIMTCGLFLYLISSIYRGYLLALNYYSHVLISIFLEIVLTCLMGLFGCKIVLNFGTNVGALLHQESVSFVYGTMGVLIGFAITQLIICIYTFVIYIFASADYRRKLSSDSGRRNETVPQLVPVFVENATLTWIRSMFFQIPVLLLQKAYLRNAATANDITKTYSLWGSYYTKYLFLIGILCALVVYRIPQQIRRIQSSVDDNDGGLNYRMDRGYLVISLASFPATVLAGVLASSYLRSFFGGMTTSVAPAISVGCLVILFYSYSYFAVALLSKLQYFLESMLAPFLGLLSLIGYLFLQRGGDSFGLKECSIGLVFCFGVTAIISNVLLFLRLRFSINLIRSVAKPALLAMISGLLVMFLVKLLPETTPGLAVFIPGLLLGVLSFMIGAMLLDLVTEDQLSRLPLGFLFIALGHTLNILD